MLSRLTAVRAGSSCGGVKDSFEQEAGIPRTTELLSALLSRQGAIRQDKVAVAFEGQEITWLELDRRSKNAACALRKMGVRPGDKVAFLGSASVAYLELLCAAVHAAACVVPLPADAGPSTIEVLLRDASPRVLAMSEGIRREWAQDPTELSCDELLTEARVALDFVAPGWASHETICSCSDAGGDYTPECNPLAYPADDSDFNIIYSSGSTGTPKGIVHSQRMRALQVERMARLGVNSSATTLISTPMHSNATLVALLPTLALGGTTVLMRRFDADGFLELSQRYSVSHAMLVPVQFQRLLSRGGFASFDLNSYVAKFCTGAPLLPSLKREIVARWPGDLIEIYGLTEGFCTTVLDVRRFPEKMASVGRVVAGAEVRILSPDGRNLPVGEVGEIAGRSLTAMTGYHNQPNATEPLRWLDADGRLFYRTGDLGRLDEEGFLYVVGRQKDVIISGGFNVHAADIERVLCQHPAVAEAAVIGVESERWGETPVGFVTVRDGHYASAESIASWANSRLDRISRLAELRLCDHLPYSEAGKVQKIHLKALFAQDAEG